MVDGIARSYFCISAVSTYHRGEESGDHEFEDLDLVPGEVQAIRAGLTELGLVELFTGREGNLTHEELRAELRTWRNEYDPDDPPPDEATIVLYCTGHGSIDRLGGWRLVPANPGQVDRVDWTEPAGLLLPILERKDVSQVVLILDACFAGEGARDTLTRSLERAPILGSTADVWVIAAARRSDKAQQMAFASAFVDSLRRHSARELDHAYLDPSAVTVTAAGSLRRNAPTQVPWLAAGYKTGGCRALPNPRFMPLNPPDWIERRWSAHARGVGRPDTPGWFFTGRDPLLEDLARHLVNEKSADSSPVLLLGLPGSGKTAIVARLLTTATTALRNRLPVVARRGYLPTAEIKISCLDVDGLPVQSAAAEVARLLGLPPLDGPRLAIAAGELAGPHGLVIDQVDQAADPLALINELILPLSAALPIRLVVAARPTLAPALPNFRQIIVESSSPEAEALVEAYLRERMTYGLVGLNTPMAPEVAGAVRDLARACAGNFSAAVIAAEALLHGMGAGRRMTDARAEAERGASGRLDALCRDAMARFPEASEVRFAHDLAACLSAACSYSPDGWLPAELWAAVARRVNGLPYTAENVEAAGERALAFLQTRHPEGGRRLWRPRYGYIQVGHDPAPYVVVQHLLDEVRRDTGPQWAELPPETLAILLGAAGHGDGRFATLLDDADLLLAAPAHLVVRTLKDVRSRADGHRRIATWAGVPVDADPRDRALLLGLRAASSGLVRLAATVPDGGAGAPQVAWVSPTSSPDGPAPVTRLAVAGTEDAARVVTAHDDGSVHWWDGSDGQRLGTWPGLRAGNSAVNAGVVNLAAAKAADGLLTVVVTGDRRALAWDTEGIGPPRLLSTAATRAAVHPSGLIALVDGAAVTMIDTLAVGRDGSWRLPDPVVGVDFAGPVDEPVLWLADVAGRVWRQAVRAGTGDPPLAVGLCPPVLLLAGSRTGPVAVVVDVHGGLTFPQTGRRVMARPHPTPDVRSVAVDDDWLVLGGGTGPAAGWLEFHGRTTGRRWRFDGSVVGLHFAGDLLMVATPNGLAALTISLNRQGVPVPATESEGAL